MRIVSVLAGLSSGGAEILVRNLSREFVKQGHVCHVVATSDAQDIGNSPVFEADFKRALQESGVSFEILGHAARRNPLIGAIRLRRAVKRFRPDVMHVHVAHILVLQAAGLLRLPTVYTHHNIRLTFPRAMFRLFDRFVDCYVGISDRCAEMLRRHTGNPLVRIFNGVPADFAAGRPRTALSAEPIVLSVGARTAQKDYPTLIRAAALCIPELEREGVRPTFLIAGPGGDAEALQRLIDEQGVAQRVKLLGARTDVPELMAQADLLVNSSIFEGLPITLIEAAMSSLPAVATDVGGNGEIVRDGVSGYLVPPGRHDLLAQSIVDVLADEPRYIAFSAAAREAAGRFTLGECARSHLELYRDLLAKGARSGVRAPPAD